MDRMRAAAGMSPAVSGSEELLDVRNEIALAEQGSRQTGQLNPRHPGALNDALQFGKKVMRRSLTWYTRPLHLFQGAVIRALQHTANILDDHRGQLHQHSEALNLQADAIDRNKAWFSEQSQALRLANAQEMNRLREQMEATSAQVAARVEASSARIATLENRIAGMIDDRLTKLQREVREVAQGSADSNARFEQLNLHIDALKTHFNALHAHVQELAGATRQTASQLRVRERDLRRLRQVVGTEPLQRMATKISPVPPMFPAEIKDELAFDYFAFEEKHRGDEADTLQKQQVYVDYFRGRENVVDIGCGRGEFLEVLRSAGIQARGIELGTDQILLCQEKGLEVIQQDLFDFLESTPDDSLGGIFSSQVIEHMTASDQLRYVALAYKKCASGSPVIFETINPQCVFALLRNFFLDPTHVRPIHPETLQFAMDSCGFLNVELRFSAPLKELQVPRLSLSGNPPGLEAFNAGIDRVNELLYGYQDYAAIGWK